MRTKKNFDTRVIETILATQINLDAQIAALTAEKEKRYAELDEMVLSALLKANWKPTYNEKAVYVDLVNKVAWHVWFLEMETRHSGISYRFREVPNGFPVMFHFINQPAQPTLETETHSWVLPMKLYQTLARVMRIFLYPDRHEEYMEKMKAANQPIFYAPTPFNSGKS